MRKTLRILLTGFAMLSLVLTASPANASSNDEYVPLDTCVGSSFSGTLGPDRSICYGNYRVIMQRNGDLVLWNRLIGKACWRSGTNRAPGGDTSARFIQNYVEPPHVVIHSTSQGRLAKIIGANRLPTLGTNANVNSRGEFWIGYKRIGWC